MPVTCPELGRDTFRSKKHKERFENPIMKRRLLKEKRFALVGDEFPKIQLYIIKKGWGSLCAQPTVGYLRLVQEFYANAYRVDNDDLSRFNTVV